ncbi:MAG TPA: family 43 glycosylhydrolase, partial [Thermoanaerobaculia bacterium]|nr:family 43 glycosylhydrolase [Thermoanaerobaculia bacterium]
MRTLRLCQVVIPLLAILLAGSALAYQNPVIFADYSDPDVIRAGDDYYLVASSFQAMPGLPILHSRDLVHWTILSYAAPRHENELWAPSLRLHDGWFWIYAGDPDRGIYMTRARDPRGPWEPLTLVKEAKGWIDPCPLWDDDGSVYLIHAWAKSRAGFNGVLTVNRLSPDGRRVLDEGTVVAGYHPTLEGPKFYKRNGWYWIFAPAGGVKNGYQLALRSKSVYGPYEEKVVLEQGPTAINGPHQGAWVEAMDGSSWFLHFQDRGAWGRVVLLEPMQWINEWPEIGHNGHPVVSWRDPLSTQHSALQTSDDFNGPTLGLQWQWDGIQPSLHNGRLLLTNGRVLQKFIGPSFRATTHIDESSLKVGERAGLIVTGDEHEGLFIERTRNGLAVRLRAESRELSASEPLALRVDVSPQAVCRFSFSRDGKTFQPLSGAFIARPGHWIGARV